MILCSCCVIRQEELRTTVRALLSQNPKAPVTLNRVYKHLGRKPDCTDCSPLLTRRINIISAEIIVQEDILRGQEIPRRLK